MADEQTAPTDAQLKAAAAAESLAAEGQPVTNRTVRQRAGVAMAVAAEAARAWNDAAAQVAAVAELPDTVLARFQGIWREAYIAARDEFAVEREALAIKLRASDEERDALTKDLTDIESRIAQLTADGEAERADHHRKLAVERSRADRAEGALDAVTAERDRLLAQLERTHDKQTSD